MIVSSVLFVALSLSVAFEAPLKLSVQSYSVVPQHGFKDDAKRGHVDFPLFLMIIDHHPFSSTSRSLENEKLAKESFEPKTSNWQTREAQKSNGLCSGPLASLLPGNEHKHDKRILCQRGNCQSTSSFTSYCSPAASGILWPFLTCLSILFIIIPPLCFKWVMQWLTCKSNSFCLSKPFQFGKVRMTLGHNALIVISVMGCKYLKTSHLQFNHRHADQFSRGRIFNPLPNRLWSWRFQLGVVLSTGRTGKTWGTCGRSRPLWNMQTRLVNCFQKDLLEFRPGRNGDMNGYDIGIYCNIS